MTRYRKQTLLNIVIPLSFFILFPKPVFAIPFGIYEPRSLAMGGAGVASASSVNAVFYNPAILATYRQYKERAKNEAFSFPVLAVRASKAVETLFDQRETNYEADITNNFNAYNANPTLDNAQNALNSIHSLYSTLDSVANNLFLLDAGASLVVGIPSKYQGGAFYINHRAVGDGQLNVPASDLETLNNYQEALLFVTSNGTEGAPHPELFDGSGNLIDPAADVTSEADARGALLTELGVGLSRQVSIAGSAYSLGFTPKMVQVTSYDFHKSLNSSAQDLDGTKSKSWQLNFDAGVLKEISPRWRVGLVVKDLIKRSYPTSTGQQVTIKPQWRLGVAYMTSPVTYTVDLDLQRNDGIYPGNSAQFVLAGMEIKQGIWRYRLGYRDTIASSGPKQNGVFSAGLGLNYKPVYFDLAYSESHQQRAAGMMFGFHF